MPRWTRGALTSLVLMLFLLLVVSRAAPGIASFLGAPIAHFVYPPNVRSERDLPACGEYSSCSVVHRRFWGVPPLVERLCRCPGRFECPITWNTPAGPNLRAPFSMHLNTRAQLKFCKDVSQLQRCRSGESSLTITSRHSPPDALSQAAATVVTLANAACYCPGPPARRHWMHRNNVQRDFGNGTIDISNTYACAKLPRCNATSVCGSVRADLFSAYYHCSCLRGSLCLFRGNQAAHNTSELLFTGLAYRAQCTPHPFPANNTRI